MIPEKEFAALMAGIGLPQASERYGSFRTYCGFLQEYNAKVNLTAITDDEGVAVKHFADSLLPLTLCELPQGASLVDVGTGAGFPGVPLKLVRPDLRLTLLDPLEKRLVFLRELCGRLGIEAETVHLRAEQAGREPKLRGAFDAASSRAVASLGLLAEYCLPLLRTGGVMLAMKGELPEEELEGARRAVRLCGGGEPEILRYALPGGDARALALVRKVSPTPAAYPRPTAKIAKTPL